VRRPVRPAQPPSLLAYAAKLAELAREQREGRLRLNPRAVTSMSESISPAERAAVTEAFGVPVVDMFVSTEGLVGRPNAAPTSPRSSTATSTTPR
jgi:phenylacetate-CoA ligase